MSDIGNPSDCDLFAHLSQIDERLEEICASGIARDPDLIMEQLTEETTFVRECVDTLMQDLEIHPDRFTNLNRVVDLASREFLMSTTIPVVVKSALDPTLPELSYADEAVLAAVLRTMELCADHAGPGCEFTISTTQVDGSAVLRIETHGIASLDEPTLPVKLRSISLTDLVRSLGAELNVQQGGDSLVMTLNFQLDAAPF